MRQVKACLRLLKLTHSVAANCFSSVLAIHDDPRIVVDLGTWIVVWNVACAGRAIVGWKTRA
jgi:hypothetical protein